MMPSSGDQANAEAASVPGRNSSAKPKVDWTSQVDSDQVFRLIDGILPFEACLYHQVLPLSLEGSRLRLGMVNLDDSAALDYVRRILAYMNCSLVPQTMSSELHHAVLTAYLNYTGSQQKATYAQPRSRSQSIAKRIERKLAQENVRSQIDSDVAPPETPEVQPTFLVDTPDQPGVHDSNLNGAEALKEPIAPVIEQGTQIQEITPLKLAEQVPPLSATPVELAKATFLLEPENQSPAHLLPDVPVPGAALPVLEVNAKHLTDPVEVLANLPPNVLLQELLGRVLMGGIGRLYFERQQGNGRILWSQNGVLQSVLEKLHLDVFQGVINEIKLLTRLPLVTFEKPKQVEIERLYQKTRLLIRVRVMPGTHGEEATLQVLRGAALKFYQQQQLASLSRDALNIAQDLQKKVDDLRSRTQFYPMVTTEQLGILPALEKVLKNVLQQLDSLKNVQVVELDDD